MNPVIVFIRKYFLNGKFILSFVALIFIWHLGPSLAEQYQTHLPSPYFELACTVVLVLAWVFYGVYRLLKSPIHPSLLKVESLHKDALVNLKISFNQAVHAIRHAKSYRLRGLYQRPWILLLGPPDSGKTALLKHASLKMEDANHRIPETPWHWFLGEQGIFVDVDGSHSMPESNNRVHQSLWQAFLKSASECRPQQPFSSILLVIDLPRLCENDESAQTYTNILKAQISSLQRLKSPLPITLLISKVDLMGGFSEFFNDLSPEERKQLLGFMLPSAKNAQEQVQHFNQQFNHFIAQMSQRLIWRLHQERSLRKRGRLKDFPLQLERLKPFLERLITQLPCAGDTQLNGIYFSSSLHPATTLLLTDANRPSRNEEPLLISKSYFAYGLLNHLSHASHFEELHQVRKAWRRLGAYPATALALTLAALLLHSVYQENVSHITELQNGLKLLASAKELSHHQPWMAQLNVLHATVKGFAKTKNVAHYRWVGMGETHQLQNKTVIAYERLLNQNFANFVQDSLQKRIQSSIKNNKSYALFSSLKTYLMLSDPKHLNVAYIHHWFATLFAKQFSEDEGYQAQLLTHLDYFIQMSSRHLDQDLDLIKTAQKKLDSYALDEDGLLILEDQYQEARQPLLSQKHALPGVDFSHASIPSLYDLKNFNAIYDQKIPLLLSEIKANDWVFGEPLVWPETAADETKLTDKIRKTYIEHYAASWKKAMYNIQFSTPPDFKTAQESIGNLANPQSTFWRLIRIMINNASINIRYNQENADNNLVMVTNYVNGSKEFQDTHKLLGNLGLYLNLIAQARDVNNAAYLASIKHIQEDNKEDPLSALLAQANRLPVPIQYWLKSLTQGSWELMLTRSAAYLDYLYTTTVFPEYNLHINNNYPVFKGSKTDINLENFNSFFGPEGTMDSFFNYYVKPFVDTKHFYWKWEKVDGKTLPIAQTQLEMFLRASLIRKMFYATDNSGAAIEFELKPEGLSPSARAAILNIDGQVLQFSANHSEATILHWPGPDAGFASLRFDTLSKLHPIVEEHGTWAWFRLLDQSTLETTSNAKQFKLMLKIEDNTASYKLMAPTAINPYLPNIMDKFRLGPSLLD